jgi:hypothetical protein
VLEGYGDDEDYSEYDDATVLADLNMKGHGPLWPQSSEFREEEK